MEKIWRIIDAEFNRVTEGIRVIEDLARFVWDETLVAAEAKQIRSRLAALLNPYRERMLANRDVTRDWGLEASQKLKLDSRGDLPEVVTANFKRVQEGLRSLEEYSKLACSYEIAKEFEMLRFRGYALEKDFLNRYTVRTRRACLETDIYGITASEYSLGRSNFEVVQQMLEAGIRIIQYREKDQKMLVKYQECVALRELTAAYGACFIVNDDIHLALAVGADGVHLGQDDLPVDKARELVGDRMLIGLSTHSPQQAEAAVRSKVDYIGVGPIYRTFTKKDVGEPVGTEYLDYVAKRIRLPFVAIGGIKESNVAEVIKHGARCVALVSEITGAKDIKEKILGIRSAIAKAKES